MPIWNSEARIDMTVSAPQLGKSLVLGLWLLAGAWEDGGRYPFWPSWWAAPTYEMARSGFARYVVEVARSAGILKHHTESPPLRAQLINGSWLSAVSWDKPTSLYGPTVARVAIDEFGQLNDPAWMAISSRTRETVLHGLGEMRMAGNVGEIGGTAQRIFELGLGGEDGYKSRTWTWRDRAAALNCICGLENIEIELGADHDRDCMRGLYLRELDLVRANMSETQFRALYGAEWLDWSALPVYAFDRAVHVDAERAAVRPGLPVHLSCDFNVDPMGWVIGQSKGDEVWDTDEICQEGHASTRDGCREFIRRFPDKRTNVVVFGDASGRSRDTRSKHTDYEIIRQELGGYYHSFREDVPSHNPPVTARVEAVNARLKDAKGQVRYWIHPRCERTANDRAQVSYKPGVREIDKSNKHRTHFSDASDYRIASLFPIQTVGQVVATGLRRSRPRGDSMLTVEY